MILALALACAQPIEAPPPAPEAAPQGPVAGPLVTNDEFSAWLSSHPDYAPATAIAAGLADEHYLARWPDGKPPPSKLAGPVGGVSFAIAQVYCKDHGGVAGLDQPPKFQEVADMIFEIRTGPYGTAVFVSSTADVPTDDATTSPYATFRCAN